MAMYEVKVDVKVEYKSKKNKVDNDVKFKFDTNFNDNETVYDTVKNVDKFAQEVYELFKRR